MAEKTVIIFLFFTLLLYLCAYQLYALDRTVIYSWVNNIHFISVVGLVLIIFLCFVLEHLRKPQEALGHLKAALKSGGTITVIEGDHGSAYFHPESRHADRAIQCLIDIQAEMGGNSRIGRQLYPLLSQTGFENIAVSPRMVYVDSSKPEL